MSAIRRVRGAQDIAAVTELAWEFIGFLRDRYPERADSIDRYLVEQRFEEMLANLPAFFNPPHGECLLAELDGAPVGIVMLKRVTDELAEMNRMFVRPSARGRGVGRALCDRLIAEARTLGYSELRLGALDRHVEALPLYRSLGFGPDPDPPAHARTDPGVISLRLTL